MADKTSTILNLRRVFQQAFVVQDIAESLVSFDDSISADELRAFMDAQELKVVGLRTHGLVDGYVEREGLSTGAGAACKKAFEESQVVLDSAPLAELIMLLRDHRQVFVSSLGRVGGIVTRSDLQKPPIRMWLFGMVTLIEMRFNQLIERYCPDDSWLQYLSSGRIAKAEQFQAERRRKNQELRLLDCLQLADKSTVIARDQQLRNQTRFTSRRQLESASKQLEQLRNNLAHSQDIVNDWDTILFLSENLESLLEGPPGLSAS